MNGQKPRPIGREHCMSVASFPNFQNPCRCNSRAGMFYYIFMLQINIHYTFVGVAFWFGLGILFVCLRQSFTMYPLTGLELTLQPSMAFNF